MVEDIVVVVVVITVVVVTLYYVQLDGYQCLKSTTIWKDSTMHPKNSGQFNPSHSFQRGMQVKTSCYCLSE